MVNKGLKSIECGVSDKVMGTQNIKGFVKAGLVGLSALLLGCLDADTETVSNPVDEVSLAQAETTSNTLEFSTKDKPTKTIQTPWGPREIYDPVQDEEVNEIFREWYEKDEYSIIDYSEHLGQEKKGDVFLDAEALQSLDLKRAGCESVIQSNGYTEAINQLFLSSNQLVFNGIDKRTQLLYFTKDCGEDNNFGHSNLTVCENENKSLEPRSEGGKALYRMWANGERTYIGAPDQNFLLAKMKISKLQIERGPKHISHGDVKWHEVIGNSSGKSYHEQLQGIFEQSCEKWRGSKPHDSSPLANGFTLIDHYPNEPLAPEEFQTPVYRDFMQQKMIHNHDKINSNS